MMKLLRETRADGVELATLSGRLDAASAQDLKDAVTAVLAAGQSRLLVDFAAVEFLDSTGLGVLVGGLKAARQAGGDLRLAAPTPQVLRLLRLTTLDRVFRIQASAGETWEA